MQKINVVIPMAGLGSRFKNAGFKNIKPLIPLNGKTFIEWSVDAVDFQTIETQFIFIVLEENRNILEDQLYKIKPNCIILSVESLTRGATETALYAKEYVNNDDALIITNCDQIFEWDKEKYVDFLKETNPDSNVVIDESDKNNRSYILLDENNYGVKLAEKEVISNNALNGIHYWKHGKYFVESGEKLIEKNIRSNNEFYISLTYNILIENGLNVSTYKLGSHEKYLSIGTPEDLIEYLNYKNMNIKTDNISRFTRGWYVGNFEPSILKDAGVELGYLHFKKGKQNDFHYHEFCTEINLLVKGKMNVNGKEINEGDIFVFDPMVPVIVVFLEDTNIVVLKNKYSNKDKVIL